MVSTSSQDNPTTMPSDWVSFSPFNGEVKSTNASNKTETKNDSNASSSSSSNGWPLDEIMDDIEQQMDQQNDAIVSMKKQLEHIEVILAEPRGRQSKSKRSSTPSRSSLKFLKNHSSYVSMGDDEQQPDKRLSHKHSVVQILQRRSELKREKENSRFLVATPNIETTSPTIGRELVSPSQIQNPRHSRDKTYLSPPTAQRLSSQQTMSVTQMKLSSTFNNNIGSRSILNYDNSKRLRSSLTWDESMSSNRSIPSDGVPSESHEERTVAEKSSICFGKRKVQCFLVVLAAILVLMIGLVVGEWAQQNYSTSGRQPSPVKELPGSGASPEIVPIDANDTTSKTNDETSETTYNNQEPLLKEDMKDSHPTSTTSEQSDVQPTDEGPIQSSQDIVVTQNPTTKPTTEPTSAPIEAIPFDDLVGNEQNSEISETGYDYTANTDFLVGVYYYPWHGKNFHNGGGYMRKELSPRHVPALGEYDDSDPQVIAHHMEWFRRANIGLLVTSWWGPNRLEDSITKDVVIEHEDVGNLKIALHYETTSRLGAGREKLPNARTDIKYMCENYFDHPNYYKIDGRPVLFIYISRKLHSVGTLEEALLTMRSTASKCGHNVYLIGDAVFESAPDPNEPHVPFWYFDAVTNYDIYGSSGRPEGYVGTSRVDNYYQQQAQWREQALRDECRYVPAVSPGYNDRGVRMERDHPPLSRRITSTSQEGSLFHYQLKQAKKLVDWKVDNMILVNSFNEWHEDTQIEPVVGEPSSEPYNFTKGLQYEGYGELYLDILAAATSSDTAQHTKFDYLFRSE